MVHMIPLLQGLASNPTAGWALVGAGLGAGLSVIGAGIGVGRIGGQSADAVARQPEPAWRRHWMEPGWTLTGTTQ